MGEQRFVDAFCTIDAIELNSFAEESTPEEFEKFLCSQCESAEDLHKIVRHIGKLKSSDGGEFVSKLHTCFIGNAYPRYAWGNVFDTMQKYLDSPQKSKLSYKIYTFESIAFLLQLYKTEDLSIALYCDSLIRKYEEFTEALSTLSEEIDAAIQIQEQEYEAMTKKEKESNRAGEQAATNKYNDLYRRIEEFPISNMRYLEADKMERQWAAVAESICRYLHYNPESDKKTVKYCMNCVDRAQKRKKELQPYVDEVLSVPGGYMRKKLKEYAPEKFHEMQKLLDKKQKYLDAPDVMSFKHWLCSIVMLIGGAIFCKAMMGGAPYSGLFCLYSSDESMGLYHMAIFAWAICGLLYIDHFHIIAAFFVAHAIIPLIYGMNHLPILHLIWPLVGLAALLLTVYSTWDSIMWSRAYDQAQKYYKENIESLEDVIWQEVEEKYGELALRSEVSSIIN